MSSKSGKTPTKKSSKSTVASPQGQVEVSKTPKTSGKTNSSKTSASTASVEVGEHNMVNLQQVFRASRALKTHVSNLSAKNNGKTQLLASESPVTVEILLHKVPISANMKRHVITLAKPIRDKTSTDICVFVRDSKTAKEKLNLASAPNIKKVIALSKLRTHYNQYEARRLLAQSYDLFLVEDTILPDVCRQLGSSFLRIRKAPVPIKITSRAAETIAKIRDATLFDLSGGVTQSYKIGDTGFTEEELVKNFAVSIDQVVKRLPLGWANVKQIALIAAHCAPLPVYNNLSSPSSKESSNDNTAVKDTSAETPKSSKSKRPAPSAEETDAIAPSPKKTKLEEAGKSSKANGKTSNTPIKAEIATPSKKTETPKTKSETPKTKSETPKTKSETPKTKSETPKAKSETPKSVTPKAKSETPKTPSTKMEETTPKSANKSATKASAKSSAPSTPATSKTTASTSSSSKVKPENKSPKTTKQSATPKASTPSTKKPSTPTSLKKK